MLFFLKVKQVMSDSPDVVSGVHSLTKSDIWKLETL